MTEEQKKLLTEKLLKECWHEWQGGASADGRSMTTITCKKCKVMKGIHFYRTFLTWPDLGACMEALVREKLFDDFEMFSYDLWRIPITEGRLFVNPTFTAWLFRPVNEAGEAHFCALVCSFLEKGKEK